VPYVSSGKLKLENVTIVRDPKNFPEGVDKNVAMVNLHVALIAVNISLRWFLSGKGWIRELQASGIKGVIDQRALDWSGPPPPRRPWKRGDFVLERLFLYVLLCASIQ